MSNGGRKMKEIEEIYRDGSQILVCDETYTLRCKDGSDRKIRKYIVTDKDGNVLDCTITEQMTEGMAVDKIASASGRPRQTPSGDYILKLPNKAETITTIRGVGAYSMAVVITEQAKILGLKRGDLVKATLERVDRS